MRRRTARYRDRETYGRNKVQDVKKQKKQDISDDLMTLILHKSIRYASVQAGSGGMLSQMITIYITC